MLQSKEETLQVIEISLGAANDMVEFGKAIERLQKNKDFKRVVIDGYLNAEAVRLVHQRSQPGMDVAEIDKAIVGIGQFVQYLNVQKQKSAMAAKSILELESERSLVEEEADVVE